MAILPTNRPPAVPQRALLFGLLLSLSFWVLGGAGAYFVRKINSSYSIIIDREIPAISLVRDIALTNAQARRKVDLLPADPAPLALQQAREQINALRAQNSERVARLRDLLQRSEVAESIDRLLDERGRYWANVDSYLESLSLGISPEEFVRWRELLNERDLSYLKTQDELADYCARSSEDVGRKLSSLSEGISWFFIVLAAWPVILASGFLIIGIVSTFLLFRKASSA